MRITQKEMVEKDVTIEVFCNKCGGSCARREGPGWVGLVEHKVRGVYASPALDDFTEYTFSLCEDCLVALFKTFKIQVQTRDFFYG